jgi:hypothetical protein
MKTRSKITGPCISSVPVFLINKGIDFRFDAEKREIRVPLEAESSQTLLEIWGFTKKMVTVKKG